MRRVVVTGLGLCTPLGSCVDTVWKRLLLGQSGIQSLKNVASFKDFPCQVAGLVPIGTAAGEFNPEKYVKKSVMKTMSQYSVYSLGVATEALGDAEWMPDKRSESDQLVTGVCIGSAGTSYVQEIIDAHQLLKDGQYRKISPYTIPILLPNMPSGHISMHFKLKGPNHCVSTACSSGLHSIGDSAQMIARGACDVMVAGSVDFSINKFNSEPQKASRPFDSRRNGFVPSEGAGIVILEELEHAKHRKANIYAEILGYGMSSDAYHITSPLEDGNGAARAMEAALTDARIDLKAVGHVNTHATSTPLGDLAENSAIKQLFGRFTNDLLVYAPKGAMGHLLGASGTVEAIVTILSVKNGIIPPNLNLEERSKEFEYIDDSS